MNNYNSDSLEYLKNIVQCKRCGTGYNKYLKKCPKCGKRYSDTSNLKIIIYSTVSFFFIIFLILLTAPKDVSDFIRKNIPQLSFISDFYESSINKEKDGYFNELDRQFSDNYYYSQLSDTQKKHYLNLYNVATNFETTYNVPTSHNTELYDIQRAIEAFNREHPEFFWISNNILYRSINNLINTVEFRDADTEGYDLKTIYDENIRLVDKIISYSTEAEGIEQIRKIHDLICANISYDLNVKYSQDIRCATLFRKCVCASYAKLFQLCMQKIGYDCYYVSGTADNSLFEGNHAWNFIVYNNTYYFCDVTWDDINDYDRITYNYFMCGNEIFTNHFYDDAHNQYDFVLPH